MMAFPIRLKRFSSHGIDYACLLASFIYLSYLMFSAKGDEVVATYIGAYILPFYYLALIILPLLLLYLLMFAMKIEAPVIGRLLFLAFVLLAVFPASYLAVSFLANMMVQLKVNPFDSGNIIAYGIALVFLAIPRLYALKEARQELPPSIKEYVFFVARPFALALASLAVFGLATMAIMGMHGNLAQAYAHDGLAGLFAVSAITFSFGCVMAILGKRRFTSNGMLPGNGSPYDLLADLAWAILAACIIFTSLSVAFAREFEIYGIGKLLALALATAIYLFPILYGLAEYVSQPTAQMNLPERLMINVFGRR
jgi:hypothetical protein